MLALVSGGIGRGNKRGEMVAKSVGRLLYQTDPFDIGQNIVNSALLSIKATILLRVLNLIWMWQPLDF